MAHRQNLTINNYISRKMFALYDGQKLLSILPNNYYGGVK